MTDTIPETARLTADVVCVADRDGVPHVLLIRRRWNPYEGMWALPGGHVDTGETVQETATRELAEETGIHTSAMVLVGVYSTPGRDPRGRYVTWAYVARLDTTPEPTAGDDARAAQWTPLPEALASILAFDHNTILANAAAHLT
ncbi:MAG TPA: NUDIX hydrolase [Mycobacteriales bacterium]|nr:NUDIX hydrolase [Mycobacteriales bacterium]